VACPEFEDLLLDYRELAADLRRAVDAHLAICGECRDFQEALAEVDGALAASFAAVEAPVALGPSVMGRIDAGTSLRRPSFVPEILDLAGGAAVLAVALVMLEVFLAGLPLDIPTYWVAGALFVASGLLFAYRSYADS